MTTVLITGSEGNMGPYLVRTLADRHPSWRLLRVSRHERGAAASSSAGALFHGDLTDREFVRSLFDAQNIDYVIHAASTRYNHSGYGQSPFDTVRNDSEMTLHLLEAARAIRRFVYLSSAVVYEHAAEFPLVENMTLRLRPPTSSYGLAKFFGERLTELASKQFGVPFTIWRPFNVVSPLEPHESAGGHVFVDFYRKLVLERTETLRVMGSGRQLRCFLWVQDAADCIVEHLESGATKNEIFNLASDEPKTLLELKDILISVGKNLSLLPPDYQPQVVTGDVFAGVDGEKRIPCTDKLRAHLGWRHRTSFEDCFRDFVDAKRAHDRRSL
jgi:nucleoside-diphosphate-sugar epimerase